MLKGLIERMAKGLVDKPDQVQVSEIVTDSGLLLEIEVAKDDTGQITGKRGKNPNTMRTILSAAKARKRVTLEIAD